MSSPHRQILCLLRKRDYCLLMSRSAYYFYKLVISIKTVIPSQPIIPSWLVIPAEPVIPALSGNPKGGCVGEKRFALFGTAIRPICGGDWAQRDNQRTGYRRVTRFAGVGRSPHRQTFLSYFPSSWEFLSNKYGVCHSFLACHSFLTCHSRESGNPVIWHRGTIREARCFAC